jgi:hypothetical protein
MAPSLSFPPLECWPQRQPERSGKIARRPEDVRIGVECDHRRGDHGPEGRDLVEETAHRVGDARPFDLRLQFLDSRVEARNFGGQYPRGLAGRLGQAVLRLRQSDEVLDPVDAFGGDEAELREMAAQRVHAHRSLLDQQFASLVQHERGLLVRALDRNEPHLGPRHRLARSAAASLASVLPRFR